MDLIKKIDYILGFFRTNNGNIIWHIDTNICVIIKRFLEHIKIKNNSLNGQIKIFKNKQLKNRYFVYLDDQKIEFKKQKDSYSLGAVDQYIRVLKFLDFIKYSEKDYTRKKLENEGMIVFNINENINPWFKSLYEKWNNNSSPSNDLFNTGLILYFINRVLNSVNSIEKDFIKISFSFIIYSVYLFYKNELNQFKNLQFWTQKPKLYLELDTKKGDQKINDIKSTYNFKKYQNISWIKHVFNEKFINDLYEKILFYLNDDKNSLFELLNKNDDEISGFFEKYRGKFKNNIIENRRCLLSFFNEENYTEFDKDNISQTNVSILEGCHIYEWKKILESLKKDYSSDKIKNFNENKFQMEENGGFNGLLLTPTLHKLFDKNLFWIKEDGTIHCNAWDEKMISKQFFGPNSKNNINDIKIRPELVNSELFQKFLKKRYSLE